MTGGIKMKQVLIIILAVVLFFGAVIITPNYIVVYLGFETYGNQSIK